MEGAVDELLGSPLVFPDATNTGISAVMTTTEPLNSLKKKTVVVCTAEHVCFVIYIACLLYTLVILL